MARHVAASLALQTSFSYPELEDLQTQSSSVFSDVIADELGEAGVTFNGKTEPIIVNYVSGNFFTALGVQPLLGRFARLLRPHGLLR